MSVCGWQVMVDTKQLDGETNLKPRESAFPSFTSKLSEDGNPRVHWNGFDKKIFECFDEVICDSPLDDCQIQVLCLLWSRLLTASMNPGRTRLKSAKGKQRKLTTSRRT